jgi:CO/xanthine dehydrogenase FAD-binding subunit
MAGEIYHTAASIVDALQAKQAAGAGALYVAGRAAVQLGWSEGFQPPALVDVARLGPAEPCRVTDHGLELSAFVSLESLRRDPVVQSRFGVLARALETIATFSVRGLGTLGGNLTWRKGDLRPLFLAMQATLITSKGPLPIAGWLDRPDPDALLLSVCVAMSTGDVVFEKIGFRHAFSPTRVVVALGPGPEVPLIAVGSGENVTGRLLQTEAAFKAGAALRIAELAQVILSEGLLADDADMCAGQRAEVVSRVLLGHMSRCSRRAREP